MQNQIPIQFYGSPSLCMHAIHMCACVAYSASAPGKCCLLQNVVSVMYIHTAILGRQNGRKGKERNKTGSQKDA